MSKYSCRSMIFFLLFMVFLSISYGDIICVTVSGSGGCHNSLTGAITAASDGDIIQVAAGTYNETVVVAKSLVLEGGWNETFTERNPDVHVTTIDAGRAGAVIHVKGGIEATIDGFVITGGDSSNPLGWGGGILVYESSFDEASTVYIRNNVIKDNIACDGSCQGHGGGIMVYRHTAHIENNEIYNNRAQLKPGEGGKGGGIFMGWMSSGTIIGNEIYNNTAAASPSGGWTGQGGGVNSTDQSVVIEGNHIHDNIAAVDGPGNGGGIYGIGEMTGNQIVNNKASVNAEGKGGGIYASTNKDIIGNLIQGNLASQNGDGTGGGIYGVQIEMAKGNQILNNRATRGGGLYLDEFCRVELIENQIRGNEATGLSWTTYDGGGGIWSKDDEALIEKNDIIDNTAKYAGGGILIKDAEDYVIKDNFILNNKARGGGGINVFSAAGIITRNSVIQNKSDIGGGLYFWGDAAPMVDMNTITENTTSGLGSYSGAGIVINLNPGIIITLTNNIIARNIANAGYGGGILVTQGICKMFHCNIVDNNSGASKEGVYITTSEGPQYLMNNIICGHSTGIYLNPLGSIKNDNNNYYDNVTNTDGFTPGSAHLEKDPLFANRAGGDYHLTAASAMINKGSNVPETDHDFEGDKRPRGSAPDIGADEFYLEDTYVSVDSGNDETGNGSQADPFATIEKALRETRTGGNIFVAEGRYPEHPRIQKSVNLMGGYEESGWTRDFEAHTSIIDGYNTGTVVMIRGEDVHSVIEGFDITGGYAWGFMGYGGGIFIFDDASADIRYNRIYGNVADISGGGINIFAESARLTTISNNKVFDNVSLNLRGPSLAPEKTRIAQMSEEPGGGICVWGGNTSIVNNMIYHNRSDGCGDGLGVISSGDGNAIVLNNTVADNDPGNGEGVFMSSWGVEITFHNNLMVGHHTGVKATTDTLVNQNFNGYFDNVQNREMLMPGADDVEGDPCFAAREQGYLQIRHCSAMRDKGNPDTMFFPVDDFQGDSRPVNGVPDIGADEMNDSPPFIELLTPDPTHDLCKAQFEIIWADDDPEQDAVISLYYDNDSEGFDGNLIHTPLSEDSSTNAYPWGVTATPEGVYWLYAEIDDGVNPPVMRYCEHPLMITHVTVDELADHLLSRLALPSERMIYADLQKDGILSSADIVKLLTID